MATLATLQATIQRIIRDDSITDPDLVVRINEAVSAIAGGIRLPDGRFSPPLPNLFKTGTVATTLAKAYSSLPDDYMRSVTYVVDSSGDRIPPVSGGDYYDMMLFLNSIPEKDMTETGSVYRVVVRGGNLYYQGIPSVSENLTVYYYRNPTTGEITVIPTQYQTPLIKHYVCANILGDILTGSDKTEYNYHQSRFLDEMTELTDFIGIDAEPVYYRGTDSSFQDGAICD